MLERVDRVQLVVKDRQAAARTFGEVLGAQCARALRPPPRRLPHDGRLRVVRAAGTRRAPVAPSKSG